MTKPVVVTTTKSVGISIILTILFGPVGLFYSSIFGGVLMCILGILAAVLTFGLGFIVVWPVSIAWGIVGVLMYNAKLRAV